MAAVVQSTEATVKFLLKSFCKTCMPKGAERRIQVNAFAALGDLDGLRSYVADERWPLRMDPSHIMQVALSTGVASIVYARFLNRVVRVARRTASTF